MIVTLLEKERIVNLSLPNKKKGNFWIRDWKIGDKLVSVEANHGEWIAKSSVNMWFVDDKNNRIEKVRLGSFQLYSVKTMKEDYIAHIMVEPNMHCKRYRIETTDDIWIGRSRENDICLDSIAVSAVHARLSRKKDGWMLFDENSSNGVYVNNSRIHNPCVLKPGDVIYIMGFRLIMGKGFLAIYNPSHMVSVNHSQLVPICFKSEPKVKRKEYDTIQYFVPHMEYDASNVSLEQCIDIIKNEKAALWSCTQENPHFLNIIMGAEAHISLQKVSSIGVRGCKEQLYSFCRGLILKLIASHSYTDVKLIFLSDKKAIQEFSMARWLPHMWDNQRQQSFFVREYCDVERLVTHIKKQYTREMKFETTKLPYYIVFGFNRELEKVWYESGLSKNENIRYFIFSDNYLESFMCYDILLELDNTKGMLSDTVKKGKYEFVPDKCTENLDMLYLQLANTHIKMQHQSEEHYVVELYVPAYGNTYDVHIPRNERIGEILPLIEKQIDRQAIGYQVSNKEAILCDREEGIVLDTELTPEESGVLNGTRLMLI